jgi:hypothetical protein
MAKRDGFKKEKLHIADRGLEKGRGMQYAVALF